MYSPLGKLNATRSFLILYVFIDYLYVVIDRNKKHHNARSISYQTLFTSILLLSLSVWYAWKKCDNYKMTWLNRGKLKKSLLGLTPAFCSVMYEVINKNNNKFDLIFQIFRKSKPELWFILKVHSMPNYYFSTYVYWLSLPWRQLCKEFDG